MSMRLAPHRLLSYFFSEIIFYFWAVYQFAEGATLWLIELLHSGIRESCSEKKLWLIKI
jgi:hypothetical protein